MANRSKSEIVTFKVNESLLDAMRGIPNRSDFIRRAVIAALDNTCPVCQGTGVLSIDQRRHWDEFSQNHAVLECGDCHEMRLVCDRQTVSGHSK